MFGTELLPTVLVEETQPGPLLTFQRILFRTNERADYPHAVELLTAIFFFFMWVVLRKIAFSGFLLRWARKLGAPDELVEYKWSVLVWNGIFHTWSTIWLLDWLPRHRWYVHTEWLWENIGSANSQKMELEMKCFYTLQLGYHLQSIVWHAIEDRRPDFITMMVHHFVTVALIVGSYCFTYCRIGMLVLLVHDSSDVFVCICKASHMCGWKKVSHTAFVFMVTIWFYTRLYLYPVWVIGSTWSFPEVCCFFVFSGEVFQKFKKKKKKKKKTESPLRIYLVAIRVSNEYFIRTSYLVVSFVY